MGTAPQRRREDSGRVSLGKRGKLSLANSTVVQILLGAATQDINAWDTHRCRGLEGTGMLKALGNFTPPSPGLILDQGQGQERHRQQVTENPATALPTFVGPELYYPPLAPSRLLGPRPGHFSGFIFRVTDSSPALPVISAIQLWGFFSSLLC